MKPPESSGLLHNMSAPPRMRITMRPLVAAPGQTVPAMAAPRRYRVRLGAILSEEPLGREIPREERDGRWSLILFVTLSYRLRGLAPPPYATLLARREEQLVDTLLDNLAQAPPPAGIPAFAAVRRTKTKKPPEGPLVTDPGLALFLVSRVSGPVFLRRRYPQLGPLLEKRCEWSFHA